MFCLSTGLCNLLDDINHSKLQHNQYETAPYFLQLSQNLTSDCLAQNLHSASIEIAPFRAYVIKFKISFFDERTILYFKASLNVLGLMHQFPGIVEQRYNLWMKQQKKRQIHFHAFFKVAIHSMNKKVKIHLVPLNLC